MQQTCSSDSCQSRLSDTARTWLEGEGRCVVTAAESKVNTELPLPLTPPPIFHESSTRKPAGQRCPYWPLWSVAKWRLPLPDQTLHLLFAGQLAFFPASWGQGSSWFRMFCAFLGLWWMPVVPGRPPKLHQRGGLNRFLCFFQKRGWMSVITYNLKF